MQLLFLKNLQRMFLPRQAFCYGSVIISFYNFQEDIHSADLTLLPKKSTSPTPIAVLVSTAPLPLIPTASLHSFYWAWDTNQKQKSMDGDGHVS